MIINLLKELTNYLKTYRRQTKHQNHRSSKIFKLFFNYYIHCITGIKLIISLKQSNMNTDTKVNTSVDYTKNSPVRTYMYGAATNEMNSTPSLPEIRPGSRNANKSQDYSAGMPINNDMGSSISSSRLNPGITKRINYSKYLDEEGVEMFNALMEHKTSILQMNMISNRLKRLEFEEKRARDKIWKARDKASILQQQKDQKDRYKSFMQRWKCSVNNEIEQRRRDNTFDRIRVKEHIKNNMKMKRESSLNAKKQIKETLQKALNEREMIEQKEAEYRKELKDKISSIRANQTRYQFKPE